MLEFRKVGGGTIVDVTNFGLTRDPEALLRMPTESGLSVVMGPASTRSSSIRPT